MTYRTLSRVVLAMLLPGRLFGQAAVTTAYETTDCPVPDFVKPYTIVARYDATRSRDSAYFRRLVNHTGGYLRGIPAQERHVALAAVLRRDGTLKASRVVAESGDRAFDQLALRALRDAVHSRTLGPLPRDVQGDTLSVDLLFGEPPVAGEYAVRRFSRQSRLPRLLSDTVFLSYVTTDSTVSRRKGEAVVSATASEGSRVVLVDGLGCGEGGSPPYMIRRASAPGLSQNRRNGEFFGLTTGLETAQIQER